MERAVYFSVSKSQLFSLWECEEGPSCVQSVNETKHLGVFNDKCIYQNRKNLPWQGCGLCGRGVVSGLLQWRGGAGTSEGTGDYDGPNDGGVGRSV